ncbi:hypothetical protein GCM10009613_40200 [Pseudonocardia kongjuensis]|uniref:Beta-lactamase class A n=1 Tax=Pseudonocardia kongjuensis TaxID=102227 RepID=A0ABP4ILJ1_9PSEU
MSAFDTVSAGPGPAGPGSASGTGGHGPQGPARPASPRRGLLVVAAAAVVTTALVAVSTGMPGTTVVGTPSAAPPTLGRSVAERARAAVVAQVPGAEVGVAVHDRRTGETVGVADRPGFATASVVKLLIALDVLRANGWQPPDPATATVVARMLRGSDDGAATRLWTAQGGPAVVTRAVAELQLTGTVPPAEPQEWELTRTTAEDVVTVYRFVLDRLPARSRALVLSALREAPRIALDGVDQYFGIPDALPGLPRAIKQGWMVAGGELVLNTTGVVGADDRFVVVLLTHQPGGTRRADGRAAVTAGIRSLLPALTAPGSAH